MRLDTSVAVAVCLLLSYTLSCAQPAPEITDHGVAVPASENRGMTAAMDGDGNRVVLVWEMDLSGTRHQLVVYPDTGRSLQIPVQPYAGDNAFAVWHSTRGLWYSQYGSHFYEFDPKTLSFTFGAETPSRAAMSIHEDPEGIIWAALFPNADLISFNPQTRELTHHGQLKQETWGQYPSYMAIDETGWVYVGIGNALSQLVGFNPATGERRSYVAEADQVRGIVRPFVGSDGKVYASGNGFTPHVMLAGEAIPIEGMEGYNNRQLEQALANQEPPVVMDPIRGLRSRALREWPDGSKLVRLDLEMRSLVTQDADGTERQVAFDYQSPGADIAVMCAGPDGKIYGSSSHPSRLFVYEPDKDQLIYYPSEGIAFKSLRFQGDYVFGGHYSGGIFWLLDTSKPITLTPVPSIFGREITVAQADEGAEPNPKNLGRFQPNLNIPRNAFAHPDGKHIMISGQPGYGFVGGGLIIYNLETEELTELTHEELLPDYSTMAIAALPDGNLLCGTSPRGGHGTTAEHQQASLYVLDWQTKKVVWDSGPLEQMQSMQSMVAGPDGLYYCVGGDGSFLVFDAQAKQVVHSASLSEYGSHTANQAMILGPDDNIYLGLTGALLRITPASFEVEALAQPEGGIEAGLGIIDGRVYFASQGRLMSIAR